MQQGTVDEEDGSMWEIDYEKIVTNHIETECLLDRIDFFCHTMSDGHCYCTYNQNPQF